MQEITLQFGSPFKLFSREGTVVAFCGKLLALGKCLVEFANVLVQMHGGSPGTTNRDGR